MLALHAMACVAGFIACSSLPLQASRQTGFSRVIHERGRPIVTVSVAIPLLTVAAIREVYAAPHLLVAILGCR